MFHKSEGLHFCKLYLDNGGKVIWLPIAPSPSQTDNKKSPAQYLFY